MEFTPVFVSLAQGLRSSVADDAVNPGAGTLLLQNFVVKQKEEIVPRNGTSPISMLDTSGAALPTMWRLATKGQTLVGLSQYGSASPLYAYSQAKDRWSPATSNLRGPIKYGLSTVAGGRIAANATAYLDGYVAVTYSNDQGNAVAEIRDAANLDVKIYSSEWLTGGQVNDTRVVACNGLFCFIAADLNNSEIRGLVVDPGTLASATANLTSTDTHHFKTCLDAIVVGTDVHVAYRTVTPSVKGVTWTPNTSGGGSITSYSITDASTNPLDPECMSFVRDLGGSGLVNLVTADMTTGIRLHYSLTAGLPAASYFMETVQSKIHHTLQLAAHTTSANAGGDIQVIACFGGPDVFTARLGGDIVRSGGWTASGTGVGKTLTGAGGVGAWTMDGVVTALNDKIFVGADTSNLSPISPKDYGLYKVTQAGDGSHAPILTRDTSFDTAAKITPDATVRVTAGNHSDRQYHVRKILDGEDVALPAQPGVYQIDISALAVDQLDPAIFSDPPTKYRRYDRTLWTAFKTNTHSVSTAVWVRGLGLYSHGFRQPGSSKTLLLADYDNGEESAHQGSYFVLECPTTNASAPGTTPLAAMAVDFEAGIQLNSHLQDITANAAGHFLGSLLTRTDAVATDDGQRSIRVAEIELNPSVGHHVEAVGSLFTAGGTLAQFDGRQYFPSQFPFAPDGLSVIVNSNPGGLGNLIDGGIVYPSNPNAPQVTITGTPTSAQVISIEISTGGTYSGVPGSGVLFKYSLNRGSTYVTAQNISNAYSIPNTGLTIVFGQGVYTAGGTPDQYRTKSQTHYRLAVVFKSTDAQGDVQRSEPDFKDVTLYAGQSQITLDVIPEYRLGDKPNVQLELYRSAADLPSVLNLVTTIDTSTLSNSTSISMADSDAAIATNPFLYVTGGVEPHVPVCGLSDLTLHGNRLVGISMDDPTQLLVSTPLAAGEVPAFTDSGLIQVRSKAYAVADYLENLVVFAEDATWLQAPSDGPNSQGQGVWPQLQPVEGGTTTTQPLSVCATPDGVFFASKNPGDGYQVLTRSLTIEPIGADVQSYLVAAPLLCATYVPKQSQTRVYLNDHSTVLNYDHTHRVWSVFTGQDVTAATVWKDLPVYYLLSGISKCYADDPSVLNEGPFNLTYVVESPWLQLAILKSTPYPNVGGMERINRIIGIGRMLGLGLHQLQVEIFADGDTTFPIATWTGQQASSWDWRIRRVGKCSRIKVRLTISQATIGFAIRGFTAEVGAKKGLQRFGSNLTLA